MLYLLLLLLLIIEILIYMGCQIEIQTVARLPGLLSQGRPQQCQVEEPSISSMILDIFVHMKVQFSNIITADIYLFISIHHCHNKN